MSRYGFTVEQNWFLAQKRVSVSEWAEEGGRVREGLLEEEGQRVEG